MDDEKETLDINRGYKTETLDLTSLASDPTANGTVGRASKAMAREIIRLREANELLHEKLGETIDECSALRYKLDNALDD